MVPFRMDLEARPKPFPDRLRLLLKTITIGFMKVQRRSPVHLARPLVSLPVRALSFYVLTWLKLGASSPKWHLPGVIAWLWFMGTVLVLTLCLKVSERLIGRRLPELNPVNILPIVFLMSPLKWLRMSTASFPQLLFTSCGDGNTR